MRLSADIAGVRFHGRYVTQRTVRAGIGALIGAARTSDYSYPSGYPYPYSAAIVRTELDAVEKRFLGRKPMVVVGHSMVVASVTSPQRRGYARAQPSVCESDQHNTDHTWHPLLHHSRGSRQR
jgi:hypothetical protein